MMNSFIHTPEGVRDEFGEELLSKMHLSNELLSVLHSHSYLDIQTPTFEYFDVFSGNTGLTPINELYKFFDKAGNTLCLRPDLTPSVARAAAKIFHNTNDAIRLCYSGNTFVNNSDLQGRLKESLQIGAELYNDDSADADAEMISLMIDCLKKAGVSEFIISIGNVEFFRGLCSQYGIDSEVEMQLRELISNKNFIKAEEILATLNIEEHAKNMFLHLSDNFCKYEDLQTAKETINNSKSQDALVRLIEVYKCLQKKNLENYVTFDLGMLNNYHYYTGILFRAYTYGNGDAVIKGGRYDKLMERFGKDSPAVGFGIQVDDLCSAIFRQKLHEKDSDRYLTFALTKGRLANKTMELLEKIGISCVEMQDEKTRKLIFVNEELKLKFFLAKGPDVPTYVEYGAADIGVVGEDTIMEENRKVFEVLDLGFGKCRMCVCGPESARNLLESHEMIRVATKYPEIAKDYFYTHKQQAVDIIKLNGSIELAPIVGLSEVIVDIVETGSTLRENGLTVLEEVCPLSARMIVNPVSMRMEADRVNELIKKIKELV